MVDELENLLNRELLRAYLEEKTNTRIDDATLDLIIAMLKSMTRESTSSPPANTSSPLLRRQYNQPRLEDSPSSSYGYQQKKSSGCCCTIL